MASARRLCSMRAVVMLLASAELTVAERRALRGLARASNASDRRLQSCGSATFVATTSYCSSYNERQCYDNVPCGETCESDGECGTNGYLNNCGSAEVYVRDCPTSTDGNFVYVSQNKYWSDARTYCRANYYDLASIHSNTENAAVARLCPNSCWIGGSDSAREGTWTWSDGTAWDYAKWYPGEPNDSYGEDYAEIFAADTSYGAEYAFMWNDVSNAYKQPFVCTFNPPTPTSSSSDSDDKDDNDGREDDTGMFVGIFCAFALAAAWGFHVYRKKKIKRSRGLKKELKGVKTELKRMNSELNTYKNAAVGMRVAVTAAGPTAPAPGPVMWYWQESPARLELHPVVKSPDWIPYDAATTNLLEKNYQSGAGTVVLSAAYHADTKTMTQKNVRTGFSRKLLRFEPPASKGAAPPIKPDGIAADEPCLVLDPGAMMLIAKKRDDGWAFGSIVIEAEATSPSSPGPGWSKNQGWFRMENTDIPTVDQLADFREARCGNPAAKLGLFEI